MRTLTSPKNNDIKNYPAILNKIPIITCWVLTGPISFPKIRVTNEYNEYEYFSKLVSSI